MDHRTARETLRLHRLVERARAYQQRNANNPARLRRALLLETAASAKGDAIAIAEIRRFSGAIRLE